MAYIGPEPAESFTSFATQEFSTSATTSYTLDHAVANENEIALFVNNVRQQPGSGKAYTASGTALTLSAATASTDTMYCVFLGRALQTVTPATNSVTTSMLSINGGELNLDADEDTSITADTDDQIDFKTGGTDRLKIDSTDVTVSTGNIVFGTANKGVYLGVTSATAANLLDDYEEGTWTPALDSVSESNASGDYTKIGNVCTAKFKISSDGSGSNINITGFPFTSDSGFEQQGLARETQTSGKLYFIRVAASATTGTIIRYDASSSIGSNDTFEGQITYITNT